PSRRAAMIPAGARRAAALNWADAASAFASVLSATAAADTADQRQAREAIWGARRHAQNRKQQVLASRRRRESDLQRQQPGDDRATPRLEGLALRHLPPWAIALLRWVRAASRRRLSRLRRAFATR